MVVSLFLWVSGRDGATLEPIFQIQSQFFGGENSNNAGPNSGTTMMEKGPQEDKNTPSFDTDIIVWMRHVHLFTTDEHLSEAGIPLSLS